MKTRHHKRRTAARLQFDLKTDQIKRRARRLLGEWAVSKRHEKDDQLRDRWRHAERTRLLRIRGIQRMRETHKQT